MSPNAPSPQAPAPDPRSSAASARKARRAGIRRIRRAVALGSVCLLLASWLLIFGVLASGHDPVLSRRQQTVSSDTGSDSAASVSVGQTQKTSETSQASQATKASQASGATETSQSAPPRYQAGWSSITGDDHTAPSTTSHPELAYTS